MKLNNPYASQARRTQNTRPQNEPYGGPEFEGAPDGFYRREAGPGAAPVRRDYPGYLCVRVDRYDMQNILDENGNPKLFPVIGQNGRPVLDETGRPKAEPRQAAVGFWGTTTASKEPVYMRLCTNDEQMADNGHHVSKMRRSLNAIRMGAGEQSVRGKYGELMNPETLPEESRPIFRCDNVRAITDADGFEQKTPDGFRQLRASWITAYCNHRDPKTGQQNNMLERIDTDNYSTVDINLASGKNGGPNYFRIFRDTLNDVAFSNEKQKRFSKACFQASKNIMEAWKARQNEPGGAGEPFGYVSVTTWHPEKAVRIMPGDDPAQAEAVLRNMLADPKYQGERIIDSNGVETWRRSAQNPSFIIRMLNAQGQVCGMARVTDYLFTGLENGAREAAQQAELENRFDDATRLRFEAENFATPEGRAAYLVHALDNVQTATGEEQPVGIDILPGDCSFVTQDVTCHGRFGAGGQGANSKHRIAQTLVQLGLEHTLSPMREERQNIGCAQLFVSRTARNIVNEVYKTKDMVRFRCAVTLGPNGTQLPMSPAWKQSIDQEIHAFNHLDETMQQRQQNAYRGQVPDEPAYMKEEVPLSAYEDAGPMAPQNAAPMAPQNTAFMTPQNAGPMDDPQYADHMASTMTPGF